MTCFYVLFMYQFVNDKWISYKSDLLERSISSAMSVIQQKGYIKWKKTKKQKNKNTNKQWFSYIATRWT